MFGISLDRAKREGGTMNFAGLNSTEQHFSAIIFPSLINSKFFNLPKRRNPPSLAALPGKFVSDRCLPRKLDPSVGPAHSAHSIPIIEICSEDWPPPPLSAKLSALSAFVVHPGIFTNY